MSLSEKSRTRIYQGLEPLLGEEAVGEMLSYYPARDVDEPVTKEFVRAELAVLRTEMGQFRAEMAQMAVEFHRDQRQTMRWTIGTLVAMAGLIIGAVNAMH